MWALRFNDNNDRFYVNGNNNLNNNGHSRGMALADQDTTMKRYGDLFERLCSSQNIELAFKKARKRKSLRKDIIEFEKNIDKNLLDLRNELLIAAYHPKPLKTFIVRDPKTRKISKSDFRDRIIHHALCRIIEPVFEKTFIYDTYANRLGKGSLNAIKRFEHFKNIVSKNNTKSCYVLKADIKHYFETVNHTMLLKIIEKKVKDKNILWLIKIILENYKADINCKGMPLGNLTSQFARKLQFSAPQNCEAIFRVLLMFI